MTLKTILAVSVMFITACASGPKPADWQLESKGAMERAVAAYLEGKARSKARRYNVRMQDDERS